MPSLGYMTHTVSAPSLHGKSVSRASPPPPGEWTVQPAKGASHLCFPLSQSLLVCRAVVNPYFRDENTEAQRSQRTCSGSPSRRWVLPRSDKEPGEVEENVVFSSLAGSFLQPPAFLLLAPLLVFALIS